MSGLRSGEFMSKTAFSSKIVEHYPNCRYLFMSNRSMIFLFVFFCFCCCLSQTHRQKVRLF